MNVSHYDSIILESNASAVAVLSTLNIACALITFTILLLYVVCSHSHGFIIIIIKCLSNIIILNARITPNCC